MFWARYRGGNDLRREFQYFGEHRILSPNFKKHTKSTKKCITTRINRNNNENIILLPFQP